MTTYAGGPDQIRGIVKNLLSNALLEAVSTATGAANWTEAGGYAGLPAPGANNTGSLALDSSGEQEAGSKLDLEILRAGPAGEPGIGVGGVWKERADSATGYRGQEPPQAISEQLFLKYTTTAGKYATRDACTLLDGTVLVVYEQPGVGASNYRTTVERRAAGSRAWEGTERTVYSGTGAQGYRYPCLIPVSSEMVLCAQWVNNADNTKAQVRLFQSTDQGASWKIHTAAALAESITIADYTPGELRGAYNPKTGNFVLFGELHYTGISVHIDDRIAQWASSTGGTRFSLVNLSDGDRPSGTASSVGGGIRPRVVYADGGFVVSFITYDTLDTGSYATAQRIASAYAGLSYDADGSDAIAQRVIFYTGEFATRTYGTPAGSTAIPCLDLAVSDTGLIYMIARQDNVTKDSGAIGQIPIMVSEDSGRTWPAMGKSAVSAIGSFDGAACIYNATDIGETLERVCITWSEGQLLALHNFATSGSAAASIGILHLGGHSDLCLPGEEPFKGHRDRTAYEHSYIPIVLPAATGMFATVTATGSAAVGDSTTSDRFRLQVTTLSSSSQQHYWRAATAPPGTIAEGFTAEVHVQYSSGDDAPNGQVGLRATVADGTNDYSVRLDFGEDGYRLYDINNTAYVAAATAVDMQTGVAIRLSISEGTCTVYHRLLEDDPAHDRQWTQGVTTTSLVNNTSSPNAAHLFRFGHLNPASTTTKVTEWYFLGYVSDEYNGAGLHSPPTNPDDLPPIAIAGAGRRSYLAKGLYLTTKGGVAHYGDDYTIDARAQWGIANLDPAIEGSPAVQFRSQSDGADMLIVWDLSPTAETELMPGEVLCFALVNTNVDQITVYTGDDASPTVYTEVLSGIRTSRSLRDLDMIRNGSAVRPLGSAPAGTRFIHRNEAAGGTAKITSLGLPADVVYRKIERNTAGVWTGPSTATQPIPVLNLADVDASDPTTGTVDIHMPHILGVWMNTSLTPIRKIRLKIHAQDTADGDFRIGAALFGTILPFGWQQHNTQDRIRQLNVDMRTTQSGRRHHRHLGPGRFRFRFNWTMLAALAVDGTESPSPGYVTATSDSGAPAVGGVENTLFDLVALAEELEGAPCLLIMDADKGPPNSRGYTEYNRRWSYGRIVSEEINRRMLYGDELQPVDELPELAFEEEI